jgi:hypothetical protein
VRPLSTATDDYALGDCARRCPRALNQEWIDLDLFRHALATLSAAGFEEASITAEGRYLIEYMANQEVGHVTVFQDMLQNQGHRLHPKGMFAGCPRSFFDSR